MLRQTLIALGAGKELAEHNSPGQATLQVLRGRVRVSCGGEDWHGTVGDLLVLPRERHGLHADEMTLAELRRLDFGAWHPGGASEGSSADTGLLTLDELVRLVLDWNRPVKLFIETKHPVRYGALVESRVLALLHRYGIASPASADLSRAVVMSFSAAAVWRIRRAAPMLPTVLLGETSRYLGGGAATTVGATAVGPSIATLREHPELVDRAAAQGRAMYCWTVDHYEDIEFCRDLGVGWIATNHPGRTKAWLENGLTGAGRD